MTELATIKLSAFVYFDGKGAADFGDDLVLVGNVLPLDGGTARRNIMVPAGPHAEPVTVELDPGHYVCEIALPSGDVIRTVVHAVVGEERQVLVDLDRSPHESHAWQYLIGSIPEAEVYYRNRGQRRARRPVVRWLTGPMTGFTWELEEVLGSLQRIDTRAVWGPVQPVFTGEGTFIYRFNSNGPVNAPLGGDAHRRCCLVRTPDRDRLVTVPAPWRDPDHGERPVEMLVDPKARRASPISVTVRDPRLGTGLAYFASGAFDLAAKMFNSSEQLLFEKLENPLAAAAAGYVLVGTDDGRDTPPWYSWLENLAHWVDWLPDGRILAATNQLRQADDSVKRRAARDSLLAAFSSGVPYFTIGLRWLVDGLSRFAREAEVDAAIETVRSFSYRVDMTQPFVIVDLDKEAR